MSATVTKTSRTSRAQRAHDSHDPAGAGTNVPRPTELPTSRNHPAGDSFNIHRAVREYVGNADLETATIEALQTGFAESIADEYLRTGIEQLSRGLVQHAIRQHRYSTLFAPRQESEEPAIGKPSRSTLEQRIRDAYVYVHETGEFKALADFTSEDCYAQAKVRFAKAAETQAEAERWNQLGDEVKDRGRRKVSGLRANLVLDILGPNLGGAK